MAILKDLIVHGSSRFLNKIYASELETPLISADAGVFKKLTAKDLTAETATVIGLLDVQGQLHTNTWTNSNIATIDGCFYITPTLSSDTGSIVFSSTNVASLTGNFTGVDSLYIGGSSSGSTVQWTSNSKVLLTGEVEINGQWLPLGTLLGTLSANATTSSIGLKELKDNRHNDSSIIIDIRNIVGSTSVEYRNLKISLYQRKDGNDSKPLGIYMTAMGANGKTFIDIYGGVEATTTAGSSGGFADPNLRIGNLSGLGAVEGNTPQGWGIYTTNGYFKGVVVSSAGKIGGWSIGTSGIYNGITGITTTGSTAGTFIGTGGISNYKNTSTYVNIQNGVITAKGVNLTGQITATSGTIAGWTIKQNYLITGDNSSPGANILMLNGSGTTGSYTIAGTASTGWMITAGTTFGINKNGGVYATSGKIGGWTIGTSSLYNNKSSYNNSNEGLYLGTDYIAGGAGEEWWLKKDGSAKIGAMTLSAAGVLTVPAANVSGKLTAATIDGTQITANTITADQIAAGAIKTDELDANAVTSAKIKAGEVKATNIASGAITADKLDATTINASNKLTVGALTTTDQNNILNSNIQVGGKNLFKKDLKVNSPTSYGAYDIILTEPLEANQTYIIQLWNVNVQNNKKIEAQLGIGVFYCGGSVALGSWYGNNYFNNGHANHLSLIFTPTSENVSHSDVTNPNSIYYFIRLYNSPGAVSGATMNLTIEKWKLEKGNKATDWSPAPEDLDVHKYITDIDSNKGITIKPANTSGNDYLQINSSAITTYRNNTDVMSLGDSSFRMGTASGKHTTVDSNGLHVWIGSESTTANEVGLFGSTARIGAPASSRFLLNADSLQAYNSSNVKYFEVSASGLSFGGNAVAKVSDIPTTVAELTDSGSYLTTTVASNTYATQTNLNNVTGWSVIINISTINYTTNTAILKATVYKDGVVQTSGFTLQWYKTETSTSATPQVTKTSLLTGQTNNTLEIKTTPTGDAYADTLDAAYTCIVS